MRELSHEKRKLSKRWVIHRIRENGVRKKDTNSFTVDALWFTHYSLFTKPESVELFVQSQIKLTF